MKVGDKVPDFELNDQNGLPHKLSSFQDKFVVLYFYPKDNTPGCTKEACSFKENNNKFSSHDSVIIGISPDSIGSHQRFIEKFDLPFTLLSDPDKEVIKLFGAWGKKKMYGKEYEGLIRSTFIIGKDGTLLKSFKNVRVKGHSKEILEFLETIN